MSNFVDTVVEAVKSQNIKTLRDTLENTSFSSNSRNLQLNSSNSPLKLLTWTCLGKVCQDGCFQFLVDDFEDLESESEESDVDDGPDDDLLDPWTVEMPLGTAFHRTREEALHFMNISDLELQDATFNILQLATCLESDQIAILLLEWIKNVGFYGDLEVKQVCLDHMRATFGKESVKNSVLPPLPLRRTQDVGNTTLHLASFLGHSNICRYLLFLEDELSFLVDKQQSGSLISSKSWRNKRNSQGYKAVDCAVDEGTKKWFFLVNERIAKRELEPSPVIPINTHDIKRVHFESDSLILDACKRAGECTCNGVDCPLVREICDAFGWKSVDGMYTSVNTNPILDKLKLNLNTLPTTPQTSLSPLHLACTLNHVPLTKFLIQHGHPVNIIDAEGWTPLHCASAEGGLEVVEYLINCQPMDPPLNLLAKNGEGETAWDVSPVETFEPEEKPKGEIMVKSTTKVTMGKDEMTRRGVEIRKLLDEALDKAVSLGVEFPEDELLLVESEEEEIVQQLSTTSIESTTSSCSSLEGISPVIYIDKAISSPTKRASLQTSPGSPRRSFIS